VKAGDQPRFVSGGRQLEKIKEADVGAHMISFNRTTPGQILAAAERELTLALQRLIACRNRLYRETGTYPDDLGAAICRLDFLLRDIMAGLVSPAHVKAEPAKPDPGTVQ
jgi:hypothetical protein